ncbi:MAG: type II toxin-antitoxin system HicA family toxin [Candidatus Acidiferrales bacterium]
MTPKLPVVTAKALVRVAEQLGFAFRRQRGSHAIYVRARDQARIVIPMHGGELKRKTLRAIIQDLRITVEEFRGML